MDEFGHLSRVTAKLADGWGDHGVIGDDKLISWHDKVSGLAEFWAMSGVTENLAGDVSSSMWSWVTPLAEQFEMVQYYSMATRKYIELGQLEAKP